MAHILILGADGMVGHISRLYLAEAGHDVLSVARQASPDWDCLDVGDDAALRSYLMRTKPEIVLNCVGILIKESEECPLRAIRMNALLPRILEEMAGTLGFRLIHVSSDCVFSGQHGPYREADRRDADEAYGRTKALGEVQNGRDLTIRTSKVGPELKEGGSGLFHWFMRQSGTIRGFGSALWGGVTTLEMAKLVDWTTSHRISGLVHLTNGQPISKYDLLLLFAEIWGKKDVRIERDDSRASNRSLINTRTDFPYQPPSYRDMLLELHAFMKRHASIYGLYGTTA